MTPRQEDYDAVVVGGGFFGTYLADHLARRRKRVLLVEKEDTLLNRASYANQARIHRGYHYPRSVLTGVRSRVNFSRFVADFEHCVDRSFGKYYAIATRGSNVTAAQFKRFCETIGAPLKQAPKKIWQLFSRDLIEQVYEVEEYAFNAVLLRDEMIRRLAASKVEVLTGTEVTRIDFRNRTAVHVKAGDSTTVSVVAGEVFICCYSGINEVLRRSGHETLNMRHEVAEVALIKPPEPLREAGVTVMCGPFFSSLPFPARRAHTLTHVRYTPHYNWSDTAAGSETPGDVYAHFDRRSHFEEMVRDASRYLPCMRDSEHVDSLWEIKTVLPQSERNDSRPVLYTRSSHRPSLVMVMGAKIDNVYDVCDVYDQSVLEAQPA